MLGFLLNASDSVIKSGHAQDIIQNVFTLIMAIVSLAIIVVVLMQESESGGVSAISGGSNDSFYGKNKKRSKEQILKIVTLSLGAFMLVLSVVFFAIM